MDEVLEQYLSNLERASKISELNAQVIEYCLNAFSLIDRQATGVPLKRTIENHRRVIQNLQKSPAFADVLPVVYGQQVVLMISAFEVFMSSVVRSIGDSHRSAMKWPVKINKQMDLGLLGSDATTIGDLVLGVVEQNGISFQDLAATKRYFADYLGTSLELDEQLESYFILATAIRHSYIHSAGIADAQFMKQIRNLSTVDDYTENEPIPLEEGMISELRDAFVNVGTLVKDLVDGLVSEE